MLCVTCVAHMHVAAAAAAIAVGIFQLEFNSARVIFTLHQKVVTIFLFRTVCIRFTRTLYTTDYDS